MNRQVNLTKRIRTSNGLRFCSVVVAPNGRVKPDYVLVAGKEVRHPEGAYYLEWYEGPRRIRRSVGKDSATAAARRHQQEQILASKAATRCHFVVFLLAMIGTIGNRAATRQQQVSTFFPLDKSLSIIMQIACKEYGIH